MEVIELSKELFNNENVRILGTREEPMFVAADIGKLLDIKNIHTSIKNFTNTEKVIRPAYTLGGLQETTLLTEKGLYRIVYSSKKKIAEQFREWVYEVLKKIRLTGQYILSDEIKKQLEDKDSEIANLQNQITELPPITYHEIDLNTYSKSSVVYLIHIMDKNDPHNYKFGVSSCVVDRYYKHENYFNKFNINIKLINIWKCNSASIMSNIEMKIKLYSKQNGMRAKKYELTEVINTGDIDSFVSKIDDYIIEENELELRSYELTKSRLENERILLENENLRLQIQLITLRNNHSNNQCNENKDEQFNEIQNNQDNNINNNNIKINKDNTETIQSWVRKNPPSKDDKPQEYYDKYKSQSKRAGSISNFKQAVEGMGYIKRNQGKYRYWVKN